MCQQLTIPLHRVDKNDMYVGLRVFGSDETPGSRKCWGKRRVRLSKAFELSGKGSLALRIPSQLLKVHDPYAKTSRAGQSMRIIVLEEPSCAKPNPSYAQPSP